MEEPGFSFDFSPLTMLYLKSLAVDFAEIKSAFGEDAKIYEMSSENFHLIGMTHKSKFLNINFVFRREGLIFTIQFLDVQLSSSAHVKEYWCKKRN
jgi:hypothetical protein